MAVETELKMMALAAAESNRQILAMQGQRIRAQSKKTWLGVGRPKNHTVEMAPEAQWIVREAKDVEVIVDHLAVFASNFVLSPSLGPLGTPFHALDLRDTTLICVYTTIFVLFALYSYLPSGITRADDLSHPRTRTIDEPQPSIETHPTSLQQRQQRQQQQQQQTTPTSQRPRPQPSSSSGSTRTLRRTPNFDQQQFQNPRPLPTGSSPRNRFLGQAQPTQGSGGNGDARGSTAPRASVRDSTESAFWPRRTIRISRRTASAIIFALEEAIRTPYSFTPVTAEEAASMADLSSGVPPVSNGRAQNGGSRTTAGPIPVPQNPSERVRTPTDIMRERRDREARKKAEMERQKEQEVAAQQSAQVGEPAAAGDAPADIGAQKGTRRTSGGVSTSRRPGTENLPPEELGRRTRDRNSSGAAAETRQVGQPPKNTLSGSTQAGQSSGRNSRARGQDTSNVPQPISTRRGTQSQGQPASVQAQPAASRVGSQPQPRVGQTSTAAATAETQPKAPATGSTTRNPNPPGASFESQPRSTTSSFPHAFERWETLSSHWEGLTSFWIRRLESNKEEIDKNPLNAQLARQVNDLSAAGANLFHAVVELQRLRASSERKFQRWFFEHKAEQERAIETRAGLEEALRQERSAKADAVAALTRVETDKNSAYQNRTTAEQMVKEMKRELEISKQEARRAWEELGRREQEERDRTSSLRSGQPTLVGGVQVVPMIQGGQAHGNRPSTREGPYQQGHSVRSGPESVESPVRGDAGYTTYDAARSDTDTDPFTESGANRSRQGVPPLPNTIPQPQPTSNASAAALQAAQSAALQSEPRAGPANQGGTYLRYGPAGSGQPSPSFYQHEGSSLLTQGQQVRTTEADERSYVPSVPDTNSQEEEYEMNSNGEVQRDEHGRPVPYRGDLGSEDSDEYDVQDSIERERMYSERYGPGISGVEYISGSPAVASSSGSQADYSGSGYGAVPGWEAVPRHHHPTRLSDVLEEDERTNRTSPSRASQR
ncbi:MAG: hypothetical protein Q9228_005986 [Teloschistes exilis]